MSTVVSRHKDRVVREEGDRFVKEFAHVRDRDAELLRYAWLAAAGVRGPEIVEKDGARYVTARLPGIPLDELIRTQWATMPRKARNDVIRRCAEVCQKIRDAGYAWPDLVTYHLYVPSASAPEAQRRTPTLPPPPTPHPTGRAEAPQERRRNDVRVLDPARVRRGRLDLSALYWSTEEPTVSRADRLRFWRAYAGGAPLPRLRRIGHRGRFRPYRWAVQRVAIAPAPPFDSFVDVVHTGLSSADALADHPELVVRRRLKNRVNAVWRDLVVKIVADSREAEREWENHRLLMAAGFRVPAPAVGGVLRDGRGLFATTRLPNGQPIDDVWATLDRRAAVRACADIARRLHACGLVHRDLYLCHLFVTPGRTDATQIEVTLLDLARLTRTRSRRRRVKDLAALVHSARELVTRTDLLRGLERYGGDRRLARAVLKKAARIARHIPKNVRDGTHVPHTPSGLDGATAGAKASASNLGNTGGRGPTDDDSGSAGNPGVARAD